MEIPNTSISSQYNFPCLNKIELKYVDNKEYSFYQIFLNIIPEDLLEFADKYPYAMKCLIPYKNNNDDLFMVYGITLQEKEFDYLIIEYGHLFKNINDLELKVNFF